jgi:hypothetical protein
MFIVFLWFVNLPLGEVNIWTARTTWLQPRLTVSRSQAVNSASPFQLGTSVFDIQATYRLPVQKARVHMQSSFAICDMWACDLVETCDPIMDLSWDHIGPILVQCLTDAQWTEHKYPNISFSELVSRKGTELDMSSLDNFARDAHCTTLYVTHKRVPIM